MADQAPETLKTRREFLAVAGARRKWVTPGLVLQVRGRNDDGETRVGYTASRKVGNAVTRNRARRRLRAAVRDVVPVVARQGFDIVVIARRETVDRPYEALKTDLAKGLSKLTKSAKRPQANAGGRL